MSDKKPIESAVELLTAIIALKAGGETREQQVIAVQKINESLEGESNLIIEAPTGAGKTLSYMIPIIFNESKAVISTATKQLSEQISGTDIPFLQKAIKEVAPEKSFSAALLKGRDNYYCLAKAEDQARLSKQASSLFEMDSIEENAGKVSEKTKDFAKEIQAIDKWADKTKTGDRSEAPAVSDTIWRQYSSTSGECPGKQVCPFGEQCFAEFAREKARKAKVVITNHAVVANDLKAEESVMLGERDVFVFDELHELDNYLSNAWGTRLTAKMLKDAHKQFKQLPELKTEYIEELEILGKKFNGVCDATPEGVIEGTPKLLGTLTTRLYAVTSKIATQAAKVAKDDSEREGLRKVAAVVVRKATEIMESCELILDDSPNTVRWVNHKEENKTINAAPLRVGPQLQLSLEERNAHMVGTSATIRVNGDFGIPVHNLALATASADYNTVAVDTPFNYRKQALMYIPHPDVFPAPVGAERAEHTEAVKREVVDLVKAAGGRALCLYTTLDAALENGKVLRKKFPKLNILIQGDAPAPQLIEEFKKDETSVLVATMGMWHGLDVPGPACSLVIMDKIPFKPMNDPLSTARQKWADESGRNGFMDVYVADANVMLAQGAGRLIRSTTDKGVVAILDVRLSSKAYGKAMLKSLPPMLIFQDKNKVIAALERLNTSLKK